MGGVIGRLLTVDAGAALTAVAFDAPIDELDARTADREALAALLQFKPVLRCARLITAAAPFDGAPGASNWLGRVVESVQPEVVPELRPLRRVARRNPDRVRADLRPSYVGGVLSSLTTLRRGQPVLARSASIEKDACSHHLAIAGTGSRVAGEDGDGVVARSSALHPQADAALSIPARHDVYRDPRAIDAMIAEISIAVRENLAR